MNTNSSTGSKLSVNVCKSERIASILAGTWLVVKGFQQKKAALKWPMLAAGGALMFRGASGHSTAYSLVGKPNLPDTVKNINIIARLTVNKPRMEVYHFWRQLSNLPLFMQHLKRVDITGSNTSHWVAALPGKLGTMSWDAEIVKEIEGELLGWNSTGHALVHNAGKVEFRDADNGSATDLKVVLTYRAPLGDVGEGIANLLSPLTRRLILRDVYNFKRFMEAGDLPR